MIDILIIPIIIGSIIGLYIGLNATTWYRNWKYPKVWLKEKQPWGGNKVYERNTYPGDWVWRWQSIKIDPIYLYEDGTTSEPYTTWRKSIADFREKS